MTLKSLIPVKASNFSMFISVSVFTPPQLILLSLPLVKNLCEIFLKRITVKHRMAIAMEQVLEKLDHVQLDLEYIKKHLSDLDLVLTDEDVEALQRAETDLAMGRTKRLV